MAAGDLAQGQTGYTPVLSSDDIRLGYGKINEAADQAYKYGTLSFASSTPLLAFTGASIGQLAVDRATGDVYRWTSTAWQLWSTVWKGFTPTFSSGATTGNGTLTGRYRLLEGEVLAMWQFVLGSTSSITGAPQLTMPVQPLAGSGAEIWGSGACSTGAGADPQVMPSISGTAGAYNVRPRVLTVSGTNVVRNDLQPTVPFTWATGNSFTVSMRYRAY